MRGSTGWKRRLWSCSTLVLTVKFVSLGSSSLSPSAHGWRDEWRTVCRPANITGPGRDVTFSLLADTVGLCAGATGRLERAGADVPRLGTPFRYDEGYRVEEGLTPSKYPC